MSATTGVYPPKKLPQGFPTDHKHRCGHTCTCRRPGQPECVACRVAQVPSLAHVVRNFRYGPEPGWFTTDR